MLEFILNYARKSNQNFQNVTINVASLRKEGKERKKNVTTAKRSRSCVKRLNGHIRDILLRFEAI